LRLVVLVGSSEGVDFLSHVKKKETWIARLGQDFAAPPESGLRRMTGAFLAILVLALIPLHHRVLHLHVPKIGPDPVGIGAGLDGQDLLHGWVALGSMAGRSRAWMLLSEMM
jgi:hypothetical protein